MAVVAVLDGGGEWTITQVAAATNLSKYGAQRALQDALLRGLATWRGGTSVVWRRTEEGRDG